MSNTVTPPAVKAEKKKRAKPGFINKRHTAVLDATDLVIAASRKAAYAPLLLESEIDDTFVNQLETDTDDCSERIGDAMDLTTDLRTATKTEAKARADLHSAGNTIRAAAKQKYARNGHAETLKDYHVGDHITSSRALLLQATSNMLEKLKTDTLPGITVSKRNQLKAKRTAYADANKAQADLQSQASTERLGIEADVKDILARRGQIQFAADGIWPAGDKANAPIRREFHLPPHRPLSK